MDGFRIDVVHGLGKDPALRDVTEEQAALPFCQQNDDPSTHGILRELRKAFDAHPHRPVAVGEVFLPTTEQILAYYGANDELHLAFNFPPMECAFDAACLRRQTDEANRLFGRRRRVAGVGAVEPRPAASPHPLRRIGATRPCGGGAAAWVARDSVSLCG